MKILIIEDESLAAEKLCNTLNAIDPECEILDVINSVDEGKAWLENNHHPDLILSDIHLSDGLSFAIFSDIEIECPIIFITAYEKYAIQAFEVNSIDYLLKPVEENRLRQALEKYKLLQNLRTDNRVLLFQEFKELLSKGSREYKERFLCKLGNKIKSIPTSSIRYFYSKDKITFIIDKDNTRLPINNTLDEIDQLVDPKYFFRVNRKFVVHYESISEIHPYFKGRLKINLDPDVAEDIIVSTERSPLLKSWLDR